MVKGLPAMRETQVQSLGREDPLEKEMATHSSTLGWKISWMEELVGYSPWGRKELDMTDDFTFFHFPEELTCIARKGAQVKRPRRRSLCPAGDHWGGCGIRARCPQHPLSLWGAGLWLIAHGACLSQRALSPCTVEPTTSSSLDHQALVGWRVQETWQMSAQMSL
ncbi:unnamed protein product [Rangifer tarandus platyrhynchus]|uniref:Uncharacterized protein n=1 Tax=Rangifer tarandus platyrhynchus TaxID=3082113 RepID=A0ABN8YCH5_RANTA|nr:unnamed protein product [Rangifer tarandus platyrhynchus]